jgi:hypothetical protein
LSVSQNHSGPLLVEWHKSAQPIRILFKDGSSESGWQRTGKISYVGLTEFEVSWDHGGSQTFKYDVLTTIDGRQLRFLYSSGDVVVVHEFAS